MQGVDTREQGASFPLGLTWELCEELLNSLVTWAVSYKLTNEHGLWTAVPR